MVGYGFMAHGYAKIMNGPNHFAASLRALGVPASNLMAWVTIGVELLGGLAILIGAWIPFVSVPLAVILLVAAITVHLPYGFSSIKLRAVTSAGRRAQCDNRALEVVAESGAYYRSSRIQLDGLDAPRTIVIEVRNVAGGDYEVTGTLVNSAGKKQSVLTHASVVEQADSE
jgi:uncharacterized membrane protein YphA (DoxX/SURF4 family)